jgi:hypothetical protein
MSNFSSVLIVFCHFFKMLIALGDVDLCSLAAIAVEGGTTSAA